MSRLTLPILATLACSLAFSTLTAAAQQELASLDSPATSSSSSSSAIIATPVPAAQASRGGARPFSGVGFAVKGGIAGAGFDVATPLVLGRLNLRGGASFFSYSPNTITTDNLNIDGSLKLQNAGVMVDYFPFHGRFRLSGGATVYNNTGLSASLSVPAGQSFTVGDAKYYSDPSDPIKGSGSFVVGGNKVAPRVTIGTGNMLSKKSRITFQSEIGFQYLSAPTVNYTIVGSGCLNYNAGIYSNCGPIPQSNVNAEQVKLQNDLRDLRFFPILSAGIGFRIH